MQSFNDFSFIFAELTVQEPAESNLNKLDELTFKEHIDKYKPWGEFAEDEAWKELTNLLKGGNNPLLTCNNSCSCQDHVIYSTIFITHLNYSNQVEPLPLEKEYTESSSSTDTLSSIVFENSLNAIYHPLCAALKNYPAAHSTASFKFHISIKEFSETKIGQMIKLGQFLQERCLAEEHLSFFYKMVSPPNLQKKLQFNSREEITRFHNYDQFTLYFNRFSSLGAILRLADDVEEFLLSSGYQASPPNGYKDIININQFFSARNDGIHNTDSYHYGYLKFFDHECKKFIDKYREELKTRDDLPIGALEIILLICLAIPNLSVSENQEISEEHSKIVQDYFEMMKNNPKEFISKASQIIKELKGVQESNEEDTESLEEENDDIDDNLYLYPYNQEITGTSDLLTVIDNQHQNTLEDDLNHAHVSNVDDNNLNTQTHHEEITGMSDLSTVIDNQPQNTHKDDLNHAHVSNVDDNLNTTPNDPKTPSPSLLSTSIFKGLQTISGIGLLTAGIILCFTIPANLLPIGIVIALIAAYLMARIAINEYNPVQSNRMI